MTGRKRESKAASKEEVKYEGERNLKVFESRIDSGLLVDEFVPEPASWKLIKSANLALTQIDQSQNKFYLI